MKKSILEICTFSVECAVKAAYSGADRIEFCSGPDEGGLTPAVSDITLITEYCETPLFVMIRPRGGNFVYTALEIESMKRAIKASYLCGATGLVFGILKENCTVDEEKCKALIEWANPLPCVFHKAFDQAWDYEEALETIIRCGFTRILTSGHAQHAEDGVFHLSKLVKIADGRIEIMAGGGINPGNAKRILNSGVDAIHASARDKSKHEKSLAQEMKLFHGVNKETVKALKAIVEQF